LVELKRGDVNGAKVLRVSWSLAGYQSHYLRLTQRLRSFHVTSFSPAH
jgi:hypothetical protein